MEAEPVPNKEALMRQLIVDAQKTLSAYLEPTGPSKHDTIKALLELLDGPRSREALAIPEEAQAAETAAE